MGLLSTLIYLTLCLPMQLFPCSLACSFFFLAQFPGGSISNSNSTSHLAFHSLFCCSKASSLPVTGFYRSFFAHIIFSFIQKRGSGVPWSNGKSTFHLVFISCCCPHALFFLQAIVFYARFLHVTVFTFRLRMSLFPHPLHTPLFHLAQRGQRCPRVTAVKLAILFLFVCCCSHAPSLHAAVFKLFFRRSLFPR